MCFLISQYKPELPRLDNFLNCVQKDSNNKVSKNINPSQIRKIASF
ncbi:21759_t:CDS:1, partial [Gigaspora rosea]